MDQWEGSAWAMVQYEQSELGHRARTKRLVQVASALIQSPAASVPMAIADGAQAKAAYRFISHAKVTPGGILSGHVQATARACLEHPVVLCVGDTTTLTFHSRAGLFDLGPTNHFALTRGFLAHTSLAIARSDHAVVGVLDQHSWVRSETKNPPNETCRQRKKRARESEHWSDHPTRVAEAIERAARESQRVAPRIIHVFDREGDIFEAMEEITALGHSLVIRAQRNRLLDTPSEQGRRYSLDEVRKAPRVGKKTVEVRARSGRPARTATLAIRAMSVSLKPPRNRDRKGASLPVHIVLAEETGASRGVEPLCWYLVTREPIVTAAHVVAIVRDYEARWIIEEFHMALKTGCSCEDRQMETAHGLQNFLALATPMACQLLQLRNAARKDTPVEQCTMMGRAEITVLQSLRPRAMAKVTTARQLMRVVANFGGFLNRNSDPDPGWRTLWRGFERVKLAASGYQLRQRRETNTGRTRRSSRATPTRSG
jgi:hypothetical protein